MGEQNKTPVIEFKDFSFQYFSQAEPTLHDINLTIHKGEKILLGHYVFNFQMELLVFTI